MDSEYYHFPDYHNDYYDEDMMELFDSYDPLYDEKNNFIKNVKKEKIIKNFNFIKDVWLKDFYKPDGMYVQLTDIYFL